MKTMLLEDCCEILDSKRVPITAADRKEGPYPYYGANGVQDYVAEYIFDDELVLLAEDGGNFGSKTRPIAYRVSGKCWVNNHAHVLQGKNVSTEWLYLYFSQRNISGIVTGAVQKKVSQKNMNSLKFKLPDSQELKKFDKIIQPLFSKIRSTKLENYQLEELKRVLLTKLF